MNNYILLTINCEPEMNELLIAELGDIGFEGFLETDTGFEAYLPELEFNETTSNEIFERYHIKHEQVLKKIMPQQNWNALWESNFEPVVVGEKLLIKAPFHKVEKSYPYVLTIQPKTSFGTGHHETTFLIMKLMLETEFSGKEVFDYGSGSGILAILASKLGSKHIFANDIDAWAAENIFENAALNQIKNIEFVKGDLRNVPDYKFDIILANINKNILIQSFLPLSKKLKHDSRLLISGFYEQDLKDILNEAGSHGLSIKRKEILNNWCAVELQFDRN
ncbi:MAG: 50S ribosomal protein L11 methyltransferase [Bacteroidota bacterium]|nr:50S ribosomal protein L11 methyltransferase [Bacteroidota bacterium]